MMKTVLAVLCLTISYANAEEAVARASAGAIEVFERRGVDELLVGSLPISGPMLDLLQLGDMVYVARGAQGVTAIDIRQPAAPREVTTFAVGRNAVKLAVTGGQLLVIVADYATLAFDLADPAHPAASLIGVPAHPGPIAAPAPAVAALPMTPQSAAPPAHVMAVRNGWVAIESPRPIARGDRFEIRSQEQIAITDPTSGQQYQAPSNEYHGMFEVDRVETQGTTSKASGRLPRGAIATEGDLAVPTAEPLHEPLAFPSNWRGMTRVRATLRPFLTVDNLGFGAIAELGVDYYLKAPVRVGVSMAPLGLLATREGAGIVGQLRGSAAYSTDFFEVGLALGGQVAHLGESSFLLGPSIRLGSLDGLHLVVQNDYVVNKNSTGDYKFGFASLHGELTIPMTRKLTLSLTGGGAAAWGYGLLGINSYLRGTGGPGTLIFHTAIGGAFIDDKGGTNCPNGLPPCTTAQVRGAGPTVAVGIDARF